ncbi:lamin tail domain-containing protein [Luteibacter sp. dw_328]|uniref:lamin tail domain-containing protein n=1 Tax=Luteibacter sp. dw_328 TaxID=2719796 RepID=UPI001BD1F865|nr:lamin tail domain-containing protein [Luteibacter sp. dw_328]
MRLTTTRRATWAALAGLMAVLPLQAADLTITQFRVRGPAGGNDEFVEVQNTGTAALDVSGYKLNASNSAGTTGTRFTFPAGTSVAPGCFLLLANTAASGYSGSVTPDLKYSTGVTDDGGLALLNGSGTVIDQVGLSSGSAYKLGTPLATLGSSNTDQGYGRKTNPAGFPQSSGDNSADWVKVAPTAPRASTSPCVAQGPSLSVADATVSLRNGDDVTLPFAVTLSQPVTTDVSVHAATADDTATVAAGDYDAVDTTLTIPTGSNSATLNVTVHGAKAAGPDKAFRVNLSDATGDVTIAKSAAVGAILNEIPVAAEIWQVTGTGQVSPLVGKRVATHANIVTAVGPAGFTIQTPDNRADADPLTSNGIYVFTSTAPTVKSGDVVDVEATVDNYFNLPELKNATITTSMHGAHLPRAVAFGNSIPSTDPNALSCGTTNYQCYVGMRVVIDNGMITTGNLRFSNEPFAEVYITANGTRSLRKPGVRYTVPVPAGVNLPNWSGNPEVFKMNTADFGAVAANTPFNAGTTFKAEGVMSYAFGMYTFIPTKITIKKAATLPRAVDSRPFYATRVGAFNMERFCDSDFNTTFTCSGGDTEPTPAQVALKTQRLSAYIGSVLKLPDILSVEEVKSLAVLQGLAKQLGDDYPAQYEAILQPGHDPSGINVGFLVRTDRVRVLDVRQLGADETWDDEGSVSFLHDHPPLLLTAEVPSIIGRMRVNVIAVHPKARQNVDKTGDAADRDREKRFLQAKSLATQVQAIQTDRKNLLAPLLVVGDFNSYQFSDGFTDVVGLIAGRYDDSQNLLKLGKNLVKPTLWNAVDSVPEQDRYSFLFTENFGNIQGQAPRQVPTHQVLDNALLNTVARGLFLKMQYGRGNLDAPVQTLDDSATATDAKKAMGSSDHDGFVVDMLTLPLGLF